MDVTLGLLTDSPPGDGGGGVPSGGSTTARSILTSREDNKNTTMIISSEATSSYPVVDQNLDDDLELGLGLSIRGGGSGGGLKSTAVAGGPCWSQYARILTAKDFPNLGSKQNSCSSSSSVSIPNSNTSGTKRTATDSVSPNGTSVVGWPPVSRAHRMPNLVNEIKSPTENLDSMTERNKSKNRTVGIKDCCNERNRISNKKYQSVKVNMDGTLIGRKVDLNAHTSYEMLAQTLEEMFFRTKASDRIAIRPLSGPCANVGVTLNNSICYCFNCDGEGSSTEAGKPSRLLDGTSEFVLTYEDKDGDCMLVGDVPWQMFVTSVKRLRIMKNSESAPRFQEKQ